MIKRPFMTAALLATALSAPAAYAHVAVSSGPGFADKTQEVTFGVGHGCATADTLSVRVQIPAEVTSVRALNSDLGPARVERNSAGLVTAVTWSKAAADLIDGDLNYYKLTLRLRVPNKPFTTLYFPTYQICRTTAGVESKTDWIGTGADSTPDAGAVDAAAPEPAPALLILPARLPGWNKVEVATAIADPATFFTDAQIVWLGTAAYSANPAAAELIKTEPGTQVLSSIPAGSTLWVKY